MSDIAQKGIALFISALLLGAAYYGSYLPYRKSTIFIETLSRLDQARTIDDFEAAISRALDFPSPIGQEELVRNTANIVMNAVERGAPDAKTLRELVDFLEGYYRPIIARGRGMSFGQNLYVLGVINQVAYLQTKDVGYLQASKEYYEKGYELGPKRPEVLYGLFDIYRIMGNREKAKAITEQIISQWPNDERIKSFYQEFLKENSS